MSWFREGLKSLFGGRAEKPAEAAPVEAVPVAPALPAPTLRYDYAAVIDCSADPYDVRPIIDTAMTQIKQRLATLPPEETLFVILGENHCATLPKFVAQGVLQCLKDSNTPVIVGFELAHDMMSKDIVVACAAPDIDPHGRENILKVFEAHDPEGALFISTYISRILYEGKPINNAPFAKAHFFAYCLMNEIPFYRIDTSKKQGADGTEFIDNRDERTGQVLKSIPGASNTDIAIFSKTGVTFRNQFMVDMAAQRASETGARVCVISSGLLHVFGCTGDMSDHEQSLPSIFKTRGLQALSIGFDDYEMLCSGAKKDMSDMIMVRHAADDAFQTKDAETVRRSLDHNGDVVLTRCAPGEEQAIARKIVELAGRGLELLDVAEIAQNVYGELPDAIKSYVRSIRADLAKAKPAAPKPMKW